MFNRGIRLPFKLLGIPVILDWSFLLILPLLAWLIGRQVTALATAFGVHNGHVLATGSWPYVLGLIAALGLFIGVVLHELGHAITARLYGVQVSSITLWFLGGVARFQEMPRQRGAEAIVAIAGPVVSFVLGALCWFSLTHFAHSPSTSFILGYLCYMNFTLGVFNLLPALPLDGGRVLRSLLALRLPYLRATEISAGVSKVIALLLALVAFIGGQFFLLFVAFFIYMAVEGERQMSRVEELLRGIKVREIMNPDVRMVGPDVRVGELTQRMLQDHHLGFPVVDGDGNLLGMVSIQHVQNQDPLTPVGQIMSRDLPTVTADSDASETFRKMGDYPFGRVVVVDDSRRVVGIITKGDLMRLMQIRLASAQPARSADLAQPSWPRRSTAIGPHYR